MYHIEKGDYVNKYQLYENYIISTCIYKSSSILCISFIVSYREGRFIDVVDGSASSVIIKDTKQVDFSDYAGKHIRISQYTDEGAVVLGEWLIPSNQVYLDSHLVDAWFMSGYSNDNPPASIKGYKGHELVLKNFAFTSDSGFYEEDNSSRKGSLVFDGVDDYAVCDNMPIQTDYTVICRKQIWDKQNDKVK